MVKLVKKAFLFVLPLLILGICYVVTDPYQIIFKHSVYLFDYMMLPRGNVSTKVYLQNRDKYKYDSFIFGSSRSTAHTAKEWAKYLPKNSVPFSFGAWNESIEGIYRRIKLIDSLKSPINNAFILLDVDHAFAKSDTDRADDFAGEHYLISGQSKYDYYVSDFLNYLQNPRLVLTSIDYKIFHKQRAYMEGFYHMQPGDLNAINNDWFPNSDKGIDNDSVAYYRAGKAVFYQRPATQTFARPHITKKKEGYLYKITSILNRHHTQYKIVIAPLYDQVKLNPQDLLMLEHVFGKQNVYDYSGINAITNNKFNYGNDVIHYRKRVGELIYKKIYR
jgi:hypothetical protein